MTIKVKTPYHVIFNIPHSCVVCGNVPVQGMNWKISGSKSNWNGKRTTTLCLEFPLCQECYTVSRDKGLAKFVTVMGFLVAFPVCFFLPAILGSGIFENSWLSFAIPLTLVILLAVLVRWLSNTINQRGFTPEQREQRKRVKQCAKVSSFKAPTRSDKNGSIVFEFENPSFARLFSTMNFGLLEQPQN